ncbi:MAG: hypothetical protein ACFCUE_07990 [Candidatus Bathyarchaeia archaeon]|jgi:hypothetical protein
MKPDKHETQNMLTKKAVIEIELGYESTQTPNNQIVKDIRKEAQIPWCSKIRKIEVYSKQ